jgi:hypothetical protein
LEDPSPAPCPSQCCKSQRQEPPKIIAQDAAQIYLIFDDKNVRRHVVVLASRARIGSSVRNVANFPSVDSPWMRPPCISTICLAMASRRPVPPLALPAAVALRDQLESLLGITGCAH